MSRCVSVYANRSDLLRVLQRIEQRTPLVYRECFRDTANVPTWDTAVAIESLGTAVGGEWNNQTCYLILPASVPFNLREIELSGGGKRYFVDPLFNPDSVTLRAGGLYQGECIVMSEFSTTAAKRKGFDLLECIRRVVRAEFRKWGDTYVGPEASALAEMKVRLVWRTHASPESVVAQTE